MKNLTRHGFRLDQTDMLVDDIITCRQCPRVLKHCQAVAEKQIMRRAIFADETYWGRPVPNFGKLPAKLLIVGLAPGAHGSNRTSRMFTGDDSGLWLYRALHKAGFATTAGSTEVGDNRLIDSAITSVTHCAPPDNKPTPDEIRKCEPFLLKTLEHAKPRVVLALGSIAWKASLQAVEHVYGLSLRDNGRLNGSAIGKARPAFEHGARVTVQLPLSTKNKNAEPTLDVLACYHVSRQNTNTGRLTEPMLDGIFKTARRLIDGA